MESIELTTGKMWKSYNYATNTETLWYDSAAILDIVKQVMLDCMTEQQAIEFKERLKQAGI